MKDSVMHLHAFPIRAGDTLVVLVPESWTADHIEQADRYLKSLHPEAKFILLPGDARVLTPALARARIVELRPLAESGPR